MIIKIHKDSDAKFISKGKYKLISYNTLEITELPIGMWTQNYKEFIESLISDKGKNGKNKKPIIKSYMDHCTETNVLFTIKFNSNFLTELVSKKNNDK